MRQLFSWVSLLIFSTASGQGQPFTAFEKCTFRVNSIDPKDTTFGDLKFLTSTLDGKTIVLLGEQEHGDGAAFSAKLRLIKFLNKEMGFKIVAFETPFYITNTTQEKFSNGQSSTDKISKSLVYKHWAKANEMLPLFEMVKDKQIQLAGFDLSYIPKEEQPKEEQPKYIASIDSLIRATNTPPSDNFLHVLHGLVEKGIDFIPSEKDQRAFIDQLTLSIQMLAERTDDQSNFWQQELKNLLAKGKGWWQKDAHTNENWWSSQNIRDKQMAENIVWLTTQKFKDQKIIIWAANYHVARNVSSEIRGEKYFKNENAISMGEYLHTVFKDTMFSMAIISNTGERAVMEDNFKVYKMKPRSKQSFEYYLNANSYDYSFTDFTNCRSDKKFKMAGLLHYELLGNWTNVFDGALFINKMSPVTFQKK